MTAKWLSHRCEREPPQGSMQGLYLLAQYSNKHLQTVLLRCSSHWFGYHEPICRQRETLQVSSDPYFRRKEGSHGVTA